MSCCRTKSRTSLEEETYPLAKEKLSTCTTQFLDDKTDWRSIYVASFLSFCGAVQFSLFFSSLWPFLQIIDHTTTENFFGYIIGIYSFGQILGSPIAGYWSNRIRKIRTPLNVGMWLMFLGNTIYLSVEAMSARRRLVLLVGRFITGLGSSNISLLKAYASTASTTKDRSRAIAFVTGGVALGMTTGPALQLIFTPIGYPGFFLTTTLSISMYTAPAYAACIMNVCGSLAIHFLFKEHYAGVVNKDVKANGGKKVPIPKFDPVAVALCHLTRFTQMFTHTNIETLGSPVAMVMFSWTRKEAVEYISTAQGFMSFLAFLTYIVYIVFKLDRVLNFRVNCMISLVGLVVFHLLTFSWPFLPGSVQTYVEGDNVTYASDQELLGCNVEKFSWCESLKPVNVWVYYGSYIVLIGLSFPNMNIALNTLFSKILGPRRQGTQQGILQMSGGSARMLGPIVVSSLYMAYGPRMAWVVEILVIVATLVLWGLFYDRMVPLEVSNLGQVAPARTNNNEGDEGSEQASDEGAVCPRE